MAAVHDIPMQAILLYASMRWRHYVKGRVNAWSATGQFVGRRRMIVVTAV